MKPDFDKAQNLATELLLQQSIDSLYIDVRDFYLPPYITIDSMQNFSTITGFPLDRLEQSKIDGACVLHQGKQRIILYDDGLSCEPHKHWGIVHELGHIFCDHKDDTRNSEIEAHFFAAQIVTPEIVLIDTCKRTGALHDYDLPGLFNVSWESATKRIQTLQRRCGYNYNSMDIQLLERFNPILNREFLCHKQVS